MLSYRLSLDDATFPADFVKTLYGLLLRYTPPEHQCLAGFLAVDYRRGDPHEEELVIDISLVWQERESFQRVLPFEVRGYVERAVTALIHRFRRHLPAESPWFGSLSLDLAALPGHVLFSLYDAAEDFERSQLGEEV